MKNALTTMMAGAATVAAVTASSTFMLGAATVTAVTVGSAFMAAPAEALAIVPGDNLMIGGDVTISRDTTNPNIFSFTDFTNTEISETSSNPPFAVNTPLTIADFSASTATGSILDTPIVPFISGIQLTDGSTAVFNLTSSTFSVIETTIPGIGTQFSNFFLSLSGEFVAGDTVLGGGLLTTQIRNARLGNGTSFSGELTAVPTPAAVLPGLIGMGTAVFRKKKQEDEGEVTLETAEVRS